MTEAMMKKTKSVKMREAAVTSRIVMRINLKRKAKLTLPWLLQPDTRLKLKMRTIEEGLSLELS